MDELIAKVRERAADPARRTNVPRRVRAATPPPPAEIASAVRDLATLLRDQVELNRSGAALGGRSDLGGLAVEPVRPDEATSLPKPVDEAALDRATTLLGQALPMAVRRLYLDVADGGFGPGDGLLSLDELVAAYREQRKRTDLPSGRSWPTTLVPLVAADPGWDCVDTTTGAIIAWDPVGLSERASEAKFKATFRQVAESVERWLEEWLASSTLSEEAERAGGSLVTMRFGQAEFLAMIGPSGRVPLPAALDAFATPAAPSPRPSEGMARMTTPAGRDGGLAPDARAASRFLHKVAARIGANVADAKLEDPLPGALVAIPQEARSRLALAHDRISAARLAWHVPRKSTGAPDGAAALALVPLGEPDRRPGTRETWVVARCKDMAGSLRFALTLEELISENESHRWDQAPWRWADDDTSPLSARWGARFDEARSTMDAQDAGRWHEAFAPWNVELDEALSRLLAGGDADPTLADLTATWAPRLASSMANLAPWRLPAATGALRRSRPMRLFGLGGVSQQRKPGVFLSGDAHHPRLSLEWSASNERVTEVAWVRPLDLALLHAGLIEPAAIPGLRYEREA